MARYKYDTAGKLLAYDDATGEWKREKKAKGKWDFSRKAGFTYVADIAEFIAVATDKPQLISSRSALARYERSNGIKQVGNDLKGKIVADGKRRAMADQAYVQREARRARVDTHWG